MSMYEASVRVPLLVEGPGVPQNRTETDFVTLIDLFPTFIDMANGHMPNAVLQGNSLAPYLGLLSQQTREGRPDFAVTEYTAEETNTPQFMIRKGNWKYIAFGHQAPFQHYQPQLFNIAEDPLEVNDLSGSPATQAVIRELDSQLRQVVDYPEVVERMAEENRENVRQWMASYTTEEWHMQVLAAYQGADQGDIDKLQRWLDQTGEFRPANFMDLHISGMQFV